MCHSDYKTSGKIHIVVYRTSGVMISQQQKVMSHALCLCSAVMFMDVNLLFLIAIRTAIFSCSRHRVIKQQAAAKRHPLMPMITQIAKMVTYNIYNIQYRKNTKSVIFSPLYYVLTLSTKCNGLIISAISLFALRRFSAHYNGSH